MPRRPLLRLLPLAVILLALSACSDPVEIDAVAPQSGTATICSDLTKSLPAVVAGQSLRKVTPAEAGSAWGDPAIVLECGVRKPASLTASSQCFAVSGVDWLAEKTAKRLVFTTIGRKAYVRVTVPVDYDPGSDALSDLAEPVRQTVPAVRRCV